jgi:hypothetical protein
MRTGHCYRSVSTFGLGLAIAFVWTAMTSSAGLAQGNLGSFVQDQLQKPYRKAPFPCSTFATWSGNEPYVTDLSPWAFAAGLRRGDRMVAQGGVPMTGTVDADYESWARLPRTEYVDIRVERAGKEVSLRLPCREDRPRWEAVDALFHAIAAGRWQDCIDAVSRVEKIAGFSASRFQYMAATCMQEKAKAERQPLPDEFWRRLHRWATKAVEESRYRPSGLAEVRGLLLAVTEMMEKAGRNTLADDIKQ